jgi:hypothetical protein
VNWRRLPPIGAQRAEHLIEFDALAKRPNALCIPLPAQSAGFRAASGL